MKGGNYCHDLGVEDTTKWDKQTRGEEGNYRLAKGS
jgi:hypothetical protein